MNQRNLILILIILIITLLTIVGVYIWFRYYGKYYCGNYINRSSSLQENSKSKSEPKEIKEVEVVEQKCKRNFLASDNVTGFLPEYTVKKGDTLLSIANSELNSTSRVGELVRLNKKRYPTLSLQNNFIEVGWKLFLPPRGVEITGDIEVSSGILKTINENGSQWFLNTGSKSGFNYSAQANSVIEPNVNIGDCVDLLFNPDGYKIYKIFLQFPQ